MTRNHFSPIGYGTPMNDIIERLRNPSGDIFPMCREAAAEIERLRIEIERLRAAVAKLGKWNEQTGEWARRALGPKL